MLLLNVDRDKTLPSYELPNPTCSCCRNTHTSSPSSAAVRILKHVSAAHTAIELVQWARVFLNFWRGHPFNGMPVL
eukprot:3223960-Amphidinium_carterae.1